MLNASSSSVSVKILICQTNPLLIYFLYKQKTETTNSINKITMSTQGDKTYKSKSSQLSKEQLMQAVRKKQECKAKAKLIIECLIQNYVEPADFLKMIENLNQSHYEDVVEERFILKLCGYPVCRNVLVDIPAKKYQISTATNKVYDITYRKMFCSTRCFKASEYIKTQMLTSPLWLRDQEEIPKFELLSN